MAPKPPPGMLLAPGHPGAAEPVRLPAVRQHPPVNEHIVRPETREEMVRGRRVLAQPALPPHADQHFKLDYIVGAHVRPGYVGSSDLLTRQGERSNFATDTCIRREGQDPRTGQRYLEELSFEVVNEQSPREVTERAEDLAARGVRRVLAIFVKAGEVHEWSTPEGAWRKLEGSLEDRTLATPLPISALLAAAAADDAVARALLAKGNPVLAAATAESPRQGLEKGLDEGRRQGLDEGAPAGPRRGDRGGVRGGGDRADGRATRAAPRARRGGPRRDARGDPGYAALGWSTACVTGDVVRPRKQAAQGERSGSSSASLQRRMPSCLNLLWSVVGLRSSAFAAPSSP